MIAQRIEGNTLIIELDISPEAVKAAKPSATGKTRLVASTHGVLPIATPNGMVTLALNLMTKER